MRGAALVAAITPFGQTAFGFGVNKCKHSLVSGVLILSSFKNKVLVTCKISSEFIDFSHFVSYNLPGYTLLLQYSEFFL